MEQTGVARLGTGGNGRWGASLWPVSVAPPRGGGGGDAAGLAYLFIYPPLPRFLSGRKGGMKETQTNLLAGEIYQVTLS